MRAYERLPTSILYENLPPESSQYSTLRPTTTASALWPVGHLLLLVSPVP